MLTRIAAIQLQCTSNIDQNISKITHLAKQAQNAGAKMAFLPECFDFVESSVEESYSQADLITGRVITQICSLAKESKMWFSLGGFHTKFHVGNLISPRLKNTHLIIDSDGKIVETYQKINLFDMPGKYQESEVIDGGNTLVSPVETPAGLLGLQIVKKRFKTLLSALIYVFQNLL
ncbi:deaminated glutathione amidase, chloroplastic/cytosolic-like [Octopus sinensis]|uniref:Deaminated glutathione amidase, chloroplastic/cytosolic-like n=1 Tax=Octopus sinensis TaxID=2607531 RepID=A0A6P7TQK2_9MOLL|nr:deaminated glutathione amidase, chloroplastic/cytosolic-like [Octopus sinensis]